jgi:hypothetical protein
MTPLSALVADWIRAKMPIMDQKVPTQDILGELDTRGVEFVTLRMRSASPMKRINSPADVADTTIPWWHNRRLRFQFS